MTTPRSEWKFYLHTAHALLLQSRFGAVMTKDPYTQQDGSYQIRSLYFDDFESTSYWDKIDGLEKRAKFRLRFYNGNDAFVRLEKKEKIGNKNRKETLVISPQLAEKLAEGIPVEDPNAPALVRELSTKFHYRKFRPKFFVDYTRRAFLFSPGNIRFTLDSELYVAPFRSSLFETSSLKIPVLAPSQNILEVKFDLFLASHLSALLDDIPLVRCSVSKFALCYEKLF